MTLNPEQEALLSAVQHQVFEVFADQGTDNDSSTTQDQTWAERVQSLIEIIDSLTGGSRPVIVDLTFDADVSASTGNGLLYGLGQDGLDFSARAAGLRLIRLQGVCPYRLDLLARLREMADVTPLYLVTEQNAKSSLQPIAAHLMDITITEG